MVRGFGVGKQKEYCLVEKYRGTEKRLTPLPPLEYGVCSLILKRKSYCCSEVDLLHFVERISLPGSKVELHITAEVRRRTFAGMQL